MKKIERYGKIIIAIIEFIAESLSVLQLYEKRILTVVLIFLERSEALTKHMYSVGFGNGGLPSLGTGLFCPLTEKCLDENTSWTINRNSNISHGKKEAVTYTSLWSVSRSRRYGTFQRASRVPLRTEMI